MPLDFAMHDEIDRLIGTWYVECMVDASAAEGLFKEQHALAEELAKAAMR